MNCADQTDTVVNKHAWTAWLLHTHTYVRTERRITKSRFAYWRRDNKLWCRSQQRQLVSNAIAFKNLYAKLGFKTFFMCTVNASIELLLSLLIWTADCTQFLSENQPSARMSNFRTVQILISESEQNFGFPHTPTCGPSGVVTGGTGLPAYAIRSGHLRSATDRRVHPATGMEVQHLPWSRHRAMLDQCL